jgi:hypothetical protein
MTTGCIGCHATRLAGTGSTKVLAGGAFIRTPQGIFVSRNLAGSGDRHRTPDRR